MVDQAAPWLQLLPEDQRRRWAWLASNQGAFGMPRQVETPLGSVYNPLTGFGDILGVLGTAVREPIQENVLEPVAGGLMAARDELARRLAVLPEPVRMANPLLLMSTLGADTTGATPAGLDPAALREYGRERSAAGGLPGEFAYQTATDPLTYLGGPLGRIGGAVGAAPGLVGRAGRAVQAGDIAYQRAMAGLFEGALRGAGFVGRNIPGVRTFLEESPVAKVGRFATETGRAVQNAERALAQRGLSWRDLVQQPRLDVGGTAAEWFGTIGPGWDAVDRTILTADHPAKQMALLRLREAATKTVNVLNTRGEQSRIAVMEELAAGMVPRTEGEARIKTLWGYQQKHVRSVQAALVDAADAIKATPVADLGPVDPVLAAATQTQVQDALTAIRERHVGARMLGTTVRGGPSPEEGEILSGLFDITDPQQRIAAMQGQDLAYRKAYRDTIAQLGQVADDIQARHTGTFTDTGLMSVERALRDTFEATMDTLAPAYQPVERTLAGLGPAQVETIKQVWQDAPTNLPKAITKVLSARDNLIADLLPQLRQWYSEHNLTWTPEDVDGAVGRVLQNSFSLLSSPAMRDPTLAGARAQAEKAIRKYIHTGDLLDEAHTGELAMQILNDAESAKQGLTRLPPWFAPYSTMLGAWRETALLSLRYHFANVISQYALSAAEGVDVGRIMRMQAMKLREAAGGRMTDEWDATVSPAYAVWRGQGGRFTSPVGVTQAYRGGEVGDVLGTGADTFAGRIPVALRAGVPALATGAAAYTNTPADSPDRERNAIIGAVLGGAFGASLPKFVRGNRLIMKATEDGARGAASLVGIERAMGTLDATGAGTGLLKRTYDEIPKVLGAGEMPAVAQDLMVPTGGPVSTMRELFAPGATVGGVPQVTLRARAGAPMVAREGGKADVTAIQKAFADAHGIMSPDDLAALAGDHGATMDEQLRLRALFDEQLTLAETDGLNLSNRINFDYSDVNRGVAWLRGSGVMPFVTWQTKALPKYTMILLQHPGLLAGIDELNTLSEADIEEAGLTGRFARMARLGRLGDFMAASLLGRDNGTIAAGILGIAFPYADVGRETTTPEDANPLQRALSAGQQFGFGPSPLVTFPLQATGLTGEVPASIFRTSPYLAAAMMGLTGVEANPEQLTQNLMRAARGATGAEVTPSVTGDPLKDRAIRQRIAEMAVEQTGKSPAGVYRAAMDDPKSPIWRAAQASVERQRAGQAVAGALIPTRTAFLSNVEADVRARQLAQGVNPAQVRDIRAQPVTEQERVVAINDIKRRPLREDETLLERIQSMRLASRYQAAERADPLTMALNRLGGSERDTLGRQMDEFIPFSRRVSRMPPKRRAEVMNAYLADKPVLRRYLAERRQF